MQEAPPLSPKWPFVQPASIVLLGSVLARSFFLFFYIELKILILDLLKISRDGYVSHIKQLPFTFSFTSSSCAHFSLHHVLSSLLLITTDETPPGELVASHSPH